VITLAEDGEAVLAKVLLLWKQAQTRIEEALGQQRSNTLLAKLAEATAPIR